jgi:hypothetical protein
MDVSFAIGVRHVDVPVPGEAVYSVTVLAPPKPA